MRTQIGLRWRAYASLVAGLLFSAAVTVPVAAAESIRAEPVDEIADVPGLSALRDEILDAARRRDADAVAALAAPNIQLSYGGDHGRATLHLWLAGLPQAPWTGPGYWDELQRVLEQGSAGYLYEDLGRVYYCAPYTFSADYPDEVSPFDAIAFTRPDAPVHAAPDANSEVVATVDHAIAEVLETASEYDPDAPDAPYWILMRTADGTAEGYAVSTDFNSAVGYRACFSQDPQTGDWVWDAFIAGD